MSTVIPTFGECDLEFVTNIVQAEYLPEHAAVPAPMRFSSWIRLLRSTSVVVKFINRCQKKEIDECTTLERAEIMLLRYAQTKSFYADITVIKNKNCLDKSSKLLTLTPFLDGSGCTPCGRAHRRCC